MAQQLGLADPPTIRQFRPALLQVTDYSMVTDSPTLPQTQRDNLWHVSDGLSLVRGPPYAQVRRQISCTSS